jgi:hypothetical protein
MKVIFKEILNKIIKRFGLILSGEDKCKDLINSRNLVEKYNLELVKQLDQCNSKSIIGIVFSKDRAAQLHALLGSYYDQVRNPNKLFVLFYSSNKSHLNAYGEVQEIFHGKDIVFVPQKNKFSFKEDLCLIVSNLDAMYLYFLVDDIIFIEPVDLEKLTGFNPAYYLPTLRMGLNLKYCYPVQKDQSLPDVIEDISGQDDLFSWSWSDGELDWNYPLSVDGHLFSFTEIKALLNILDYKAPNSLESILQQFKFLFSKRKGIAYRKSRIVNIPINRVQLENNNIYGSMHQDKLLQLWNEGMQIDYKSLYGAYNISAHQELKISLIKRDDQA